MSIGGACAAPIVVVGAGLSGLSAALQLRGAGHEVLVLERADEVGGRVGVAGPEGYAYDVGASVLTMPSLIDEALSAVGSDRDRVDLRLIPIEPAYHARYADGSTLDVYADADAMVDEVRRVCGPEEAQRYLDLRRWLTEIYEAEYDSFIDGDLTARSAGDPRVRRAAADILRLGGTGSLGRRVRSLVHDDRLQRLFTFQALYAGVSPTRARAIYGAIPYMDTIGGVSFPIGGMRRVPRAMAEALVAAGGRIRTSVTVTGLEASGRTIVAVHTADGERLECSAAVLTPDLPVVDRLLGTVGVPAPRRRRHYSPSAVVMHGLVATDVVERWDVRHHTIDFGAAWTTTLDELVASRGRARPMTDPSLLITTPALTDPGLRRTIDGRSYDPISVLAPCPNLDVAPLDWRLLTEPYLAELRTVLRRRGYEGIESMRVEHVDTPATWAAAGLAAGTPFSLAHRLDQTGPLRVHRGTRAFDNVEVAGCGTTPGVGIPPVLISGKLAARRLIA
ncbi:phytoene desaturase family protein [Millisia brevis]|uniref:phytoene desaturase family protein n=1 Tax=Millisia brevis TaxID=264148 RepID=UPI0008316189|nr:phytoene desaturase family protein [Millisia brevis]